MYRHVPALGHWHWLFPLPGIHFSQITTQLPPYLLSCSRCSVHVGLFSTPWTAAHQAFLSFTISQSLFKLMSIESVMSSNHLVLFPHPPPSPPALHPPPLWFCSNVTFSERPSLTPHLKFDYKELKIPCNAGDLGSILGLRRSPGEGKGSPLQYSCLENSKDRGAWRATCHLWGRTESDTTE